MHLHAGYRNGNLRLVLSVAFFVCFDKCIVFINQLWAVFSWSTNFKNGIYEQVSSGCIRKICE